jgi:hypothetical protein
LLGSVGSSVGSRNGVGVLDVEVAARTATLGEAEGDQVVAALHDEARDLGPLGVPVAQVEERLLVGGVGLAAGRVADHLPLAHRDLDEPRDALALGLVDAALGERRERGAPVLGLLELREPLHERVRVHDGAIARDRRKSVEHGLMRIGGDA